MTAREYLKQTLILDKQIAAEKEQLKRLHEQLYGSGIKYSADKVQTSGCMDKMAELVAAASDLENMLVTDITRLLYLKAEIKRLIDKTENPVYHLILFERYVNLKHWDDIAADNHFSWRAVHKIHAKAIEGFDKFLKK